VNEPDTMEALTKWWSEFRERAPLADEDVEDFCCVVVGNKMDLARDGNGNGRRVVTDAEATRFIQELIPLSSRPSSPEVSVEDEQEEGNDADDEEEDDDDPSLASSQLTERPRRSPPPSSPKRSSSIAILAQSNHHPQQRHHLISRSHSRNSESSYSRFHNGTVTTSHTTLTIYHTPASSSGSIFDVYQSARSSPEPPPSTLTRRSTSSGSAVTITPSLFKREQHTRRGPKLFFTSAKTGEGVKDVFEHVAVRVVRRWEREERRMSMREADGLRPSVNGIGGRASAAETIRLGLGLKKKGSGLGCCMS